MVSKTKEKAKFEISKELTVAKVKELQGKLSTLNGKHISMAELFEVVVAMDDLIWTDMRLWNAVSEVFLSRGPQKALKKAESYLGLFLSITESSLRQEDIDLLIELLLDKR